MKTHRYHPLLSTLLLTILLLLPAGAAADNGSRLLEQAKAVDWTQLNDPEVAHHHFELFLRAAQADPQSLDARVGAAEFAFYAWRLESDTSKRLTLARTGLRMAREAVELDPDSAAAWYWSGSQISLIGLTQGVLNSLHLIPEARNALEKVIELDEGFRNGQAVANMARIYAVAPGFPMSVGNSRRAKQMLLEGYERYPDSTYFPLFLADFAWGEEDTEAALGYLEEVMEKEPRPDDYTALVHSINQEKAAEMAALIRDGIQRDRFNDVLSD